VLCEPEQATKPRRDVTWPRISKGKGLRGWGYVTTALGARGAVKHCCGTGERLHPFGGPNLCQMRVQM
jgi:hypothetical protein